MWLWCVRARTRYCLSFILSFPFLCVFFIRLIFLVSSPTPPPPPSAAAAATAIAAESNDDAVACLRVCVCARRIHMRRCVGERTIFFLIYLLLFSRVERNQTKKKRTNTHSLTQKHVDRNVCAHVYGEKNTRIFFFCSSTSLSLSVIIGFFFIFGGHTLALVQILLSFSNDDDYCMVWCLLYLSRDRRC